MPGEFVEHRLAAAVGQPAAEVADALVHSSMVRGAFAAARRCRRRDASGSSNRISPGQVVRGPSAVPAARRAVSVGGSGLPGAAGLDPHRLARHRRGANTEALFRGVLRRARADRSARRVK